MVFRAGRGWVWGESRPYHFQGPLRQVVKSHGFKLRPCHCAVSNPKALGMGPRSSEPSCEDSLEARTQGKRLGQAFSDSASREQVWRMTERQYTPEERFECAMEPALAAAGGCAAPARCPREMKATALHAL